MDTAAYLKKQGWRGTGHSLDHSDRGIKRPLQISKKVDALGVGIQKYGAVSDQWWMRAYDQGLKDLGTGKESELDKVRKHGHDRGGLYGRFVKGQPIPGTIDEYIENAQTTGNDTVSPKAKSSKRLASKGTREEGVVKRRKTGAAKNMVDLGSESNNSDIRSLVKTYVEEAVRRGIIPAKSGTRQSKSRRSRPEATDMAKVLALAGLSHTKQDKEASNRSHMVRALRRAAMQHIERASHPP